jgi:hypothetical protein
MSDMTDPVLQAIADQNAAADAATDEPDPVAEPDTPVEEPVTDEPVPEWQQRFQTPDKAYEAWQHATAAMTQAQQQRADLERRVAEYEAQQQAQQAEPDYSMFGGVPPMPNDLAELAVSNPGQAYYYAISNPQQFGWQAEQIADELFQQWMMVSPRQAIAYQNQLERSQWAEQQAEQLAPVFSNLSEQMSSAATNWASTSLPEWSQFAPSVQQEIQSNTPLYRSIAGERPTVESLQEVVRRAYGHVRTNAFLSQPAAAAAPSTPPAATRTQTRSSAAPANDDLDEQIRQQIIKAHN